MRSLRIQDGGRLNEKLLKKVEGFKKYIHAFNSGSEQKCGSRSM